MTSQAYVSAAKGHYQRYLQSFRWRRVVRPIRLWIDGYRCRVCDGSSAFGNPLNVHHTPSGYGYKGDSEGTWLDIFTRLPGIIGEIMHTITLCQQHHHKIHEK